MERLLIILFIFGLFVQGLLGQIRTPVDADGVPIYTLAEIVVEGKAPTGKVFKEAEKREVQMERLRYNIYKVYPLVVKCAEVLNKIDAEMVKMGDKKEKKYFLDKLEKELFDVYEPQLRQLTITQGKILLKLVNRNTKHTAFDLIKEVKSGRSAIFWQMIARLFGQNLRMQYNPQEEQDIEMIIREIEQG